MKHRRAFTIIEVLFATVILAVVMAAGMLILTTGQSTWFTTEANIQLQENGRKAMDRMTGELRQSQAAQVVLFDGGGPGGSDVIRFSVPVVCQAGNSLIDNNGDVAYWGAPLTWGCTDVSCMDADGDCTVLEYKYVEYRIDGQGRVVRRVRSEALAVVRTDIISEDMADLQAQLAGGILTLSVTSRVKALSNRVLTEQKNADIYFRN